MRNEYMDLELGLLWRREHEHFDVTLHSTSPNDQERHIELPHTPLVLKLGTFARLSTGTPKKYAEALSDAVFAVKEISDFLRQVTTVAERDRLPLHLRLLLDPAAPSPYHMLRWESLIDPRDQQPLLLKQGMSMTRFVNVDGWRRTQLRKRGDLHALIVAADPDPNSLAEFAPLERDLIPIDLDAEVERAKTGLTGIPTEVLAGRGRVNLPTIIKRLSSDGGSSEIVYIICHGALLASGPVVYLEDADGQATAVQGGDLVEAIAELEVRPTLVVLSACQSAGDNATSAHASAMALAPRLAAAGIPAVLGMQGNVAVDTVADFMSAFFQCLRDTGSLHQAVRLGRQKVQLRDDWYAPVLFTRLRSGRIWFEPGFHASRVHRWPTFLQSIKTQYCTPIVGPRLSENFLVSRARAARGIAARWQVPVSPPNQFDITRVSQYLAVNQDERFPRIALTDFLAELIGESGTLGAGTDPQAGVNHLISELGRQARQVDPDDPYCLLAHLPFPVYFTTSWTNLLEDALKEAGREARVRSFEWKKLRRETKPVALSAKDVANPVVYRLFGSFDDIDSIVLTEDDYFQYLTNWALSRRALSGVLNKLTNANLMLLGFGLDDWDFRVLFRSIRAMEGADQLERLAHVAVQLNPESETLDPEVAQQYLEDYLGQKFSIHWGTSAEFLKDLSAKWQDYNP
jgi:hypothetical protein